MKDKLITFMQGRYGVDQLSKFLLVVSLILVLSSGVVGIPQLNLAGSALLIFVYVRMLSRNHHKCMRQNQKYLKLRRDVLGTVRGKFSLVKQLKDYRIFACPGCAQKVRIPRGKGKVTVTCPRCHEEFGRKS